MVYGKTTTLVVFVIISLKLSAQACCDDVECNLITNSGNCTNIGCIYENQLCRDEKCSDRTSGNCEYPYDVCKDTGSACVDAPLCSDWSDKLADCPFHDETDGSSKVVCVVIDSACKKATCSDYTLSTCESGHGDLVCKWTGSACVTVTSCADYSSATCAWTYFNDTFCFNDGAVCKGFQSCADLSGTTDPSCSSSGVCTDSGGACSFKKCSDYNSRNLCETENEYTSTSNSSCYWDISKKDCHVAVCSDWSGTSTSQCEQNNGKLSCAYNNNVCGTLSCGSLKTGSSCDSAGCYWLSSCPEGNNDGSASGIFAPALLVALLLVLFW